MQKIIIVCGLFLTLCLTGCINKTSQTQNTTAKTTSGSIKATDKPQSVLSNCVFTNKCRGATKVECLRDWLISSKCFSANYIDEYFSNFKNGAGDRVVFDYKINGNLVIASGRLENTGYATIKGDPNNYEVLNYIGPLKEYRLNATKEEALNKARADASCKISNQENILDFVFLKVDDKFDGTDPDNRNIDSSRFKYDDKGLYWDVLTTQCAVKCQIDAFSGKLNKIKGTCEY